MLIDVDCPECGGFAIPLDSAARTRAVRAQLQRSACPGCTTRDLRAGPERGALPGMWWDTVSREWMVTMPLGEGTATVPTGVRGFWARAEANAAALAIVDPDGIPLTVSESGPPQDRDRLVAFHDAGRWRLAVPCFDCGGFDLALEVERRSGVHRALAEAKTALLSIGRDCPGCVARAERDAAESSEGEPRLWFDPAVGDWVLSQTIGGLGAVTLPLGVSRLDPEPWVLETAAMRLLGQQGDETVA